MDGKQEHLSKGLRIPRLVMGVGFPLGHKRVTKIHESTANRHEVQGSNLAVLRGATEFRRIFRLSIIFSGQD